MATALQLRRGTTAQHATFTGAAGEVTVDTDKDTVVVHDGSTAGGFPLVRNGGNASLENVTATTVYAETIASTSSFSWNSATNSPAAVAGGPSTPVITNVHRRMRRCLLADNGTVNYYLDPSNSALKEDGSASVLDGTDGMVMVEIPMFYVKRSVNGTVTTWAIADIPLEGFELHPAFIKDGKVVPFRYYSAYDACYWDATDSTYKSGLNLDALTVDTGADKLASVSGVYPIVGVTRATCRSLAANRGTGWRQLDFALFSAVQLLYLVEFQSFYSQNITGAGNTAATYVGSSSNQTNSPHSVAGKSNSLGNGSTDTTTGASSASSDTAYMSFRGIENLYGNCWNWADGINVNVGSNGNVHVTNNGSDFADDTSTNMQLVSTTAPTTSNYVSAIAAIDNYFIASSVSGGSSSTYLTDYWSGFTSSNRVVGVGGSANGGATAGAFLVLADSASSSRSRRIGARLAF